MIGVIYGGDSLEHDVSITSANDVAKYLDVKRFFIHKNGSWEVDGSLIKDAVPFLKKCKVVFPLIHGGYGEDGTIQGFLEMHNIAYVGCRVLSSATCMDKDFTKRILESYGIATTPFQTFFSLDEALKAKIAAPCVIKASSLGSSFGIYKITDNPNNALKKAFSLSSKVLVEKTIEGREIWCSVLEKDEKLLISEPCEIIPKGGFFSYDHKYNKDGKTTYHLPAKDVDKNKIKKIVKNVFYSLDCKDMARVDLFITKDGEILVNEINTIPGFSKTSIFPKALINDGYTYQEILSILINNNVKAKSPKNISRDLSSSKERVLM